MVAFAIILFLIGAAATFVAFTAWRGVTNIDELYDFIQKEDNSQLSMLSREDLEFILHKLLRISCIVAMICFIFMTCCIATIRLR